ncbi:hypothetical protein Agabi119p4_10886 [Agaricus bisporus var. burnettii]|uniref:Uncharacterized protein n=1 Tax=Agaricus bisporus var. burnettii TaxID=192524 RepID=A0A8H7EW54_AGABI|nr:hypothetical protein Agabi119p4_10886 [Agaricus bisporus var. burnettii]
MTTFHFVSGSFRSLSLFLLAFDPVHKSIHHVQTLSTLGPHQYLATNQHKDRIFTTTWTEPPSLQSWALTRNDSQPWRLSHLHTVPITAISSYIDIPPPFTHIYSVGGPTGEVHLVDEHTNSFGEKTQQVLFIPEEDLPNADKTRVALRYGSHGIESTSTPSYSLTFVPVLGTNTIEIYSRDVSSGSLTHLGSSPSPRGPDAHDGPRHVKVHPNGKILYCVTEHTNFVDLYEITTPPLSIPSLKFISSRSLLPSHLQRTSPNEFRGDTLMLTPATPAHPCPYALFTTTRGRTPATRGWLSIFAIDENGYFADGGSPDGRDYHAESIIRYETPSSGGKANAIDLLTKRKVPTISRRVLVVGGGGLDEDDENVGDFDDEDNLETRPYNQIPLQDQLNTTEFGSKGDKEEGLWQEEDQGVWILLTDDDETSAAHANKLHAIGGVKVLEWGGWGTRGVHLVAQWPEPIESDNHGDDEYHDSIKTRLHERMIGGSHAVWLV